MSKSRERARRTQAKRSRTTRAGPTHPQPRGIPVSAVVIAVIAILGVFVLTRPASGPVAGAQGTPPAKPQGTVTYNSPTTETWTLAKGLPKQVMRLAFSAADTTRGYATAFLDKQTQALYASTDNGTTWQQVGTVKSPVGDYLATDPLDTQDVAILSAYAPVAGEYTFQRSLDGGHTWAAQSTTLPTTGQISQTGWSGSTFLVGFALDGALQGASAVVAFPKGQGSYHLDRNGKINGRAIPHLTALTGRHGKIDVWGNDDASTPNTLGAATPDGGNSWQALPSTILGANLTPIAAAETGDTIIAASHDKKKVAISNDGGATWAALPDVAAPADASGSVFISPKGKKVVISRGDGTYVIRGSKWSKVTSKQVADVAESGSKNAARLWSYDDQGQVIWLDA